MYEFPGWLTMVLVGWLLASVSFALGIARWFRLQR